MASNDQESMDLGNEQTKTEYKNVSESLPMSSVMSEPIETSSDGPELTPNLPDEDDKTDRLEQSESNLDPAAIPDMDTSNMSSPTSDINQTVTAQDNSDHEEGELVGLDLPSEPRISSHKIKHPTNQIMDKIRRNFRSSLEGNEDVVVEEGVDSSSGSGSGLHQESDHDPKDGHLRVNGAGDVASSDNDGNTLAATEEDGAESSDSSSSSSNSEMFARPVNRKRLSKANSETEEKVTPHVLFKEKPKHKWFIVQEVVNRQKGVGSRYHGPDMFRQRCYGSLHSVQRLELMYKLESHEGCVNTLHFNLAGTLLASGSDDLQIVIWNWAAGQKLVKYDSGHRSNVFQAKFLPLSCNTHIVSCSRDGQVRLAELSSTGVCRSTRKLGMHRGPVHKIAVQTETPHVFLSCGEDAVVMSVDVRETKPNTLASVKDGERKIALYGINSNPMNNNEFCLNGRNNFIRIYDKRFATAPVKRFCPQHLVSARSFTQVTSAMFNYNGTEILGSYNDEDIYLFDTSLTEDADYVHKYEGHRNNVTVKGVSFFGPKSEYIVSGSDCGNIFFWDKHTEAIVQWMAGDENGVVNCLEPHPQIPVIATSGLDSDVKIWVPSCEREPSLNGLKEIVVSNYIDRENENHRQPDSIDSQMLMMLWRHMRRSERRKQERASQNGGARSCGQSAGPRPPSSSDSSDSDDDNNSTFEQCTPS